MRRVVILNGSKLEEELMDGKWRVMRVTPSSAPRGIYYI